MLDPLVAILDLTGGQVFQASGVVGDELVPLVPLGWYSEIQKCLNYPMRDGWGGG